MPTRLQLARKDIFQFFDDHPYCVHKQRELEEILNENRVHWRLAQRMPFRDFLDYLLKGPLRRLEFGFPHRREVRYLWRDVPRETVLLTLKPDCHFSHFTAMQLHELTEQDPTTVYLNHEQRPKPGPGAALQQERIDFAFRRKPRMTRNIATLKEDRKQRKFRVCLLNGKHTGYLGVEQREVQPLDGGAPVSLRLTDVDRTLIDIAVRPFYAGGAHEVLNAYRRGAGRVSVNRLAGMLRKLGFTYPYHQAVGFCLEASGAYDEAAVQLFHERFEYEFDFYLTYNMKDTEYVRRWRIHVPRGIMSSA